MIQIKKSKVATPLKTMTRIEQNSLKLKGHPKILTTEEFMVIKTVKTNPLSKCPNISFQGTMGKL